MAISQQLDNRRILSPDAIGEVLGMEMAAAHGLLKRRQWREGDVALLEAAAVRLGVRARHGCRTFLYINLWLHWPA